MNAALPHSSAEFKLFVGPLSISYLNLSATVSVFVGSTFLLALSFLLAFFALAAIDVPLLVWNGPLGRLQGYMQGWGQCLSKFGSHKCLVFAVRGTPARFVLR